MAAKGCTVRVSGLPTDIKEDRLTDKLYIHFLRARHGGGEVNEIKIIKATPGSALITFEDSKVAQSVVQYGKHILLVDDKKYELTAGFPSQEVDPDKVFLCMMVTVDYSWLPLGKETVTGLQQNLPNVHCSFNLLEGRCALKGPYSEVQTLVTQLRGIVDTCVSSDTHSSGTEESSVCASADHPNSTKRLNESTHLRQGSGLDLGSLGSASPEDPTHSQVLEGNGETERTADLRDDPLLEDQSLIMDADIFRYLRRHCGEEYQHILNQHGVEAVDMTTGDVTTLFLKAWVRSNGLGVQQVHTQLSRLYQETEAQLCKEQLPREYAPRQNLQLALEVLQLRMPRLLFGLDERHISIVGSSSEVLEAKQFLLDQEEEERGSMLGKAGQSVPPAANVLDPRVGKMLKTYSSGRTEGGREYKLAARFRDAKTKEDGLGIRSSNTVPCGNTLKDFSPSPRQKLGTKQILGSGPVLGSGEMLGTGDAQAGKDFLFKKADSLECRPFMGSSHTGTVLPSENPQFTADSSLVHHMDLFGDGKKIQTSTFSRSESGSQTILRRTNSFSGYIRPKQDMTESDSGGSLGMPNRTRANSLGCNREQQDVYSVEVKAPTGMWQYMKEAYRTRLEGMTSDVQMNESQSESGVTLILRGVNSSVVDTCQQELRRLVAMVATDFYVQELPLATLGVVYSGDETLDMCCAEVQRRFQKVKLQLKRDCLLVIGPKQLCVQVAGALMEVFNNGAEKSKVKKEKPPELGRQDGSSVTTHAKQVSSQLKTHPMQYPESAPRSHSMLKGSSFQSSINPQNNLGTQREDEMGHGTKKGKDNVQQIDSTQRSKNNSGGRRERVSQSAAQKEPVFKDKQGKGGPKVEESHRIEKNSTHPTESSRKAVVPADSGLPSLPTLKYDTQKAVTLKKGGSLKPRGNKKLTQKEIQDSATSPESLEGQEIAHQHSSKSDHNHEKNWTREAMSQTCECGVTGDSLSRTACGVALCPQCLLLHVYCSFCSRVDEVRGIRGTMRFVELPLNLPGHSRNTTLKITYNIPDGLQGDGHPNPGDPFHGGIFEAYLPLNEQTWRLLPRLKKAFSAGLIFTVKEGARRGQVDWASVPHKTRVDGGKSGNGYPDSGYLTRLTEALKSLGIEDD